MMQTGTLSFDTSTFQIWSALLNGLPLVIVEDACFFEPQKLKQEIRRTNSTLMLMCTPLFHQLAEEDPSVFEECRIVMVGGDVLSPSHANRVRDACKDIPMVNVYGPTENTTLSAVFHVDRNYETAIPIGKSVLGSSVYVVNHNNQLQPYGVCGELLVGGGGVAKGYLNQPELTRDKFVENPFVAGERVYRTGDYVKMDRHNVVHYITFCSVKVFAETYKAN
jgi:non-ribosomal peptide synthetase component F